MNRILHIDLVIFFFLFLGIPNLHCQEVLDKSTYYNWFDSLIGTENVGVYTGIEYVENHKSVNEFHKFFESKDFIKGSIVFEGQPYYNVDIKYDLYNDLVLVKPPNRSSLFMISLDKNKIDEFNINKHQFVKVKDTLNNSIIVTRFCEILLQNDDFTLLKSHRKKVNQRIDGRTMYVEFTEANSEFLLKEGQTYKLRSKKDLITLFPKYKKEINNLYRINKVKGSMFFILKQLSVKMRL